MTDGLCEWPPNRLPTAALWGAAGHLIRDVKDGGPIGIWKPGAIMSRAAPSMAATFPKRLRKHGLARASSPSR